MVKGHIHSLETFGTVDGPGIRFVLFMQGCLLKCQYCHNPDTWALDGGKEMSLEEVLAEIEPYLTYYRSSGGDLPFLAVNRHSRHTLLQMCSKRLNVAGDFILR